MNPQVGDYETLFGENRPAKASTICSLQIPLRRVSILYKYQCHRLRFLCQPAKTRVIETDGVAQFLSRWALNEAGANPDGCVVTSMFPQSLRDFHSHFIEVG